MVRRVLALTALAAAVTFGLTWRSRMPATPTASVPPSAPTRMTVEQAVACLEIPSFVSSTELRASDAGVSYEPSTRDAAVHFDSNRPAVTVGELRLTALFGSFGTPRAADGRVIYEDAGQALVYSPSPASVREDLILYHRPPQDEFVWELSIPAGHEARRMDDGSVGVFTSRQDPYRGVTASDEKSAALIARGREGLEKDFLAYRLPAPFVRDADGRSAPSHYALGDGLISIKVANLDGLAYPVTIDPTVTITTTSDFQIAGNNDFGSNISVNEVRREGLGGGNLKTWTMDPNNFNEPRQGHQAVAYNGYLYVLGGTNGSQWFNDVQYAVINANGSLGAFVTDAATFSTARSYFGAAIYNGYLYVYGGVDSTGQVLQDVQVAPVGTSGTLSGGFSVTSQMPNKKMKFATCSFRGRIYAVGGEDASGTVTGDVYYATVRANGLLNAWQINANGAPFARNAAAVAYGDYLYVVGGHNGSFPLNTTSYGRVAADGSVSSFYPGSTMQSAHSGAAVAVIAGYVVVVGGEGAGSGVESAPLGAGGALGPFRFDPNGMPEGRFDAAGVVWSNTVYVTGGNDFGSGPRKEVLYSGISAPGGTTYLFAGGGNPQSRQGHGAVAWNGFLYVLGGHLDPNGTTFTTGVTYAPIQADGSIGAWTTSPNPLPAGRALFGVAVFENRLYVTGGQTAVTNCTADVLFCTLDKNTGQNSAWSTTTSMLQARRSHGCFVYNGRLYNIGGHVPFIFGSVIPTTACEQGAISGSGTIPTWVGFTFNLPVATAQMAVEQNRGKIYVCGGLAGGTDTAAVWIGTINSFGDVGGAWGSGPDLPDSRISPYSYIHNDNLYVGCGRKNADTVGLANIFQASLDLFGNVGAWVTNTTYGYPSYEKKSVQRNGVVYVTCGNEGGGIASYTDTFRVNPNGALAEWTVDTSLPTARWGVGGVGIGDYIYCVGGINSPNEVRYVKPGADGRVTSTWLATTALPTGMAWTRAAAWRGRLYIAGSQVGSTNAVYYGTPNPVTGTIPSWTAGPALPQGIYAHNVVAWNGFLYVVGGYGFTSGTTLNTVHRATISPIDGSLSAWSILGGGMLEARQRFACVVTNGFIYAIGNGGSSPYSHTIEFASIDGAGNLSAWTYTTSLPAGTYWPEAWAQDGYLYVAGGYTIGAGGGNRHVIRYQMMSNGHLGSMTETALLPTRTWAGTMFGHRGSLYLVGGYDELVGARSDCFHTTFLTPPMSAVYSRYLDLGQDRLLTSITINASALKGVVRMNLVAAPAASPVFTSLLIAEVTPGVPLALGSATARWVIVYLQLDDTFAASHDSSAAAFRDVTDFSILYNTRPATPTGLTQLENAGSIVVPVGGGVNDGTAASITCTFTAAVSDADGENVQLHVELQPIGTLFTGTPSSSSAPAGAGTHTVIVTDLVPGERYHWRAWATDPAVASFNQSYPSPFPNSEAVTDFYMDRAPSDPTPNQYEADGATTIVEGNNASSSTVIFRTPINDLDAGNVMTLQLEIRDIGTGFSGTPTHTLAGQMSGVNAALTVVFTGPDIGTDFHWQARVVDNEGVQSSWVTFGAINDDTPPAQKDFQPVNASPPVLVTVDQRNPSAASIAVAGETTGPGIEFASLVTDVDAGAGGTAKIQIEMRPIGTPFTNPTVIAFAADGVTFFETAFAATGTTHVITVPSPGENRYHWQIRAVDATPGFNLSTPWMPFGGNLDGAPADTDFYVDQNNDAPAITAVDHYRPDGTTLLAPSGTNTPGAVIRGTIADPNFGNLDGTPAAQCRLQLEIQPFAVPFTSPAVPTIDNVNFFESTVNGGDGTFLFTVPQTTFATTGAWHWQVRAIDSADLDGGWIDPTRDFVIVPNGTPADPASLAQIEVATVTAIPPGFAITTADVDLSAQLTDPLGQPCRLELEFRPMGQPFTSPLAVVPDGINFFQTAFAASGSTHTVPFTSLADGGYKWQVRCVNFGTTGSDGIATAWFGFGSNGPEAPDFRIEVANDAPASPTGLTQRTPPDNRPLIVGGRIVGRTVLLQAEARDPENDLVKLEFELQPLAVPFTGFATHASGFVPPGTPAAIAINDLAVDSYHWAVRAIDSTGASAWVEYGSNTGVDFSVDATSAIQPNPPVNPAQWLPNGVAPIATGSEITVTSVLFRAIVTHPRGEAVKLQIEIQPVGSDFTNIPHKVESSFVSSGNTAEALIIALPVGYYHWQCRTVDSRGGSSGWVSYGSNPETTPPDDPLTGPIESDPAVSTMANDFVITSPGGGANPNDPVIIGQYRDNGITAIPIGGNANQGVVTFRAFLTDSNGDACRLEIEVVPLGLPFAGRPSGVSAFVSNGSEVSLAVAGLGDGPYKWRARNVDSNGFSSAWFDYGANLDTDTDFHVNPAADTAPGDPTFLDQLKLDGVTSIPVAGTTSILGLILSAFQSDADGDACRVEVEVREAGTAFVGTPTAVGDLSPSGFGGQVGQTGFSDGQSFHWQLRVADSSARTSAWVAFGGNADPGDADFTTTTNSIADSGSSKKKCGSFGLDLLLPVALLWLLRSRRNGRIS